tara:strand:+ start:256 stop:528 length:273 start_codon:yes stop_codon:yes gene_type:complete
MKIKKIILDTNLWISFLISKKFNQIDKLIEDKRIILIFSDELLEEFIDVVSRPKLKKYFSKKDILNIRKHELYSHKIKISKRSERNIKKI